MSGMAMTRPPSDIIFFFKTMGSTFAKRNILTQLHVHIRWEITIIYIYFFYLWILFPD